MHAYVGDRFRVVQKVEKSRINLPRAIEIREKHGDTNSPFLLGTMNHLSAIYLQTRDKTVADEHIQRTYDLHVQVYGRGAAYTLEAQNNLASLKLQRVPSVN